MNWYAIIQCDLIFYDVISWYDMVCKYIMIWYDMIRCDFIWYDVIYYDMMQYDMILWNYMMWSDIIWYILMWGVADLTTWRVETLNLVDHSWCDVMCCHLMWCDVFVVCCWLLVVGCWLFVICYLLVVVCWLLIVDVVWYNFILIILFHMIV